jgi:hypothetical protein
VTYGKSGQCTSSQRTKSFIQTDSLPPNKRGPLFSYSLCGRNTSFSLKKRKSNKYSVKKNEFMQIW